MDQGGKEEVKSWLVESAQLSKVKEGDSWALGIQTELCGIVVSGRGLVWTWQSG